MSSTDKMGEVLYRAFGRDLTLQDVETVWEVTSLYDGFLDAAMREIERDCEDVETVRLLDFDIICAALWQAMPREPREYDRLLGLPQSTYHFFAHNQRKYCLPLGTEMEKADCVLYMTNKIDSARTATSTLQLRQKCEALRGSLGILYPDAGLADDKPKERAESIEKFHQDFQGCIDAVFSVRQDLALLEKIWDNEHRIEASELSAKHPMEKPHWAMLESLRDWLEDVRPGKHKANWADAYNLIWYAAVRGHREDRLHPIFASGTRTILEGPIERYLRLPSSPVYGGLQERPVVASRYLTFAAAFDQYCEGNKKRQLAVASGAKQALGQVLRARSDFRIHGIKPGWITGSGALRAISWNEFASDNHFKEWARKFIEWRSNHIDQVLAVFEYYGTTDAQLSNTRLQSRVKWLKSAIHDRRQFENELSHEDWLSKTVASAGHVWRRIELLTTNQADGVPLRHWSENLAIQKVPIGDSTTWTVRSKCGQLSLPLIISAKQIAKGRWEFSWPVRLDLADIVGLGPYIAQTLTGAKPKALRLEPADGDCKELSMGDLGEIAEAVSKCGLDFVLSFEAGGVSVSFECDISSFQARQGIDILVQTSRPHPQKIASINGFTGRCPVHSEQLAEALSEILSEQEKEEDSGEL